MTDLIAPTTPPALAERTLQRLAITLEQVQMTLMSLRSEGVADVMLVGPCTDGTFTLLSAPLYLAPGYCTIHGLDEESWNDSTIEGLERGGSVLWSYSLEDDAAFYHRFFALDEDAVEARLTVVREVLASMQGQPRP